MSHYEEWKAGAKRDVKGFQAEAADTGLWGFKEHVKKVAEFQNKVNYRLFEFMFGEMALHHWEKFYKWSDGNVINWMQRLDDEAFIYVLHQINSNDTFYAHC